MNARFKNVDTGIGKPEMHRDRVKKLILVLISGLAVGAAFNVAFHAAVYGIEGLLGGVISALAIYWMS